MGDTVINAGGGVSNARATGGHAGLRQVTISGTAVYENNTVSGFSQGGAVYAGSVIQNGLSPSPATGRNPAAAARSTAAET